MNRSRTRAPVYPVAFWGVLGFAAIVFRAVWSLTPIAIESALSGLSGLQWTVALGWVGFMVYSEGYKGFQLKVAPRVAARAMYLARNPRPVLVVILAPLFCMGLIHATRKRLIVSWCVLIGIVTMVLLVRQVGQPWRGIVDAGVVAGLMWGLISILWWFGRALLGHDIPVPSDVPGDDGAATATDAEQRSPA